MISLHIVAALVCLLVDHAFAVVELTDATFYDYAKDKEVLLVDFYAPWCGDCKALEPDFESAATSLGTRSLDLAKVDCFGAGKGLCATYGIKRWPTLKNFNRGSYTGDYNGGLSASEIAGYITTVENSVTPASNPYAMVVPQPIQQACISRCKIAKIPNKGTCFTKCKDKPFVTHNGPKKLVGMKMVAPKPVINEKSCAKCRIPQPAGRRRRRCSRALRRSCIHHRRHTERSVKRTAVNSAFATVGSPQKNLNVLNQHLKTQKINAALVSLERPEVVPDASTQEIISDGNSAFSMWQPPIVKTDAAAAFAPDPSSIPYVSEQQPVTDNLNDVNEKIEDIKPAENIGFDESQQQSSITDVASNSVADAAFDGKYVDPNEISPVGARRQLPQVGQNTSPDNVFTGDINKLPPHLAMKVPYSKNDKKANIAEAYDTSNNTFVGDINTLSPSEAMKVPYARDDKKTEIAQIDPLVNSTFVGDINVLSSREALKIPYDRDDKKTLIAQAYGPAYYTSNGTFVGDVNRLTSVDAMKIPYARDD